MMHDNQITRKKLLSTTGKAAGAALLAGSAAASTLAAAVEAAPQKKRSMATKKTVYSAVAVPTLWTARSAQHPQVSNAGRILAQKFEQETGIHIEWVRADSLTSTEATWTEWMTPRIQSGDAPDVVTPMHDEANQRGWSLPLDEYFAQPNPFAPKKYKAWKDIFYPSLMKSLVYSDGHTYTAQLGVPYPGVEVGLAINEDMFAKLGLKDPVTWSDELAVGQALKQAGSGISPWPPEAQGGNIWALALQILVSMNQRVAPRMDLKKDRYIYTDDAVYGVQKGLIGPMTPMYQAAWREMKKLAQTWISGWQNTDLEALWRKGKVGMRTTAAWEFTNQYNDPNITFKRKMVPAPYVTSKDIPGAVDPTRFTPGDGKVPAELVTAINGGDTCIIKSATKHHNNLKETVMWLQWLTAPENNAFLENENATFIPTSPDAPLASLWHQVASFRVPVHKYEIAWWGEGLFFDATEFDNVRKVFVSWITGQVDDQTFFKLEQQETLAGIARYTANLKKK
jgi:maltose-binding protein MalE